MIGVGSRENGKRGTETVRRAILRGLLYSQSTGEVDGAGYGVEIKEFDSSYLWSFSLKGRVTTTYLYAEENGHTKKETFMKW